jgi:two-component system response regulator YesN
MLKLIIADDEKTTRESLKEYVNWSALGIDRVETAQDGTVALELAKASRPNILLTDVRMPKMDGIVLATRIREIYPECRIIFISGYSDKEYLKSAIHLKAVSYIEKPIDLDEVKSVAKEAVSSCLEEEEKRRDAERLKNSLDQSRPLIRQEIALNLLKGNTGGIFQQNSEDLFLSVPETGNYVAVCIKLNWKSAVDEKEKSRLLYTMLESFCDPALYDPASCIAGTTPVDCITVILSGSAAGSLASSGMPETILERVRSLSGELCSVTIGTGTNVKTLAELPQSFVQALVTLNRQFYTGSSKIYYNGTNSKKKFTPDKNLFSHFKEFLKKDDKEGSLHLVRKLTEGVRMAADEDIDRIRNIYFNLLLLIFEAARDRNLIDPAVENERSYIWQEIDRFQSLTELSEYICSNISAFFSRFESTDGLNRKIYETIRYIRENYCNKELSIQSIADNAYLSQTYLCSFFKKSTGKTLNEYITEVRIEKAKELLGDSRIKLYEVTTSIGFTDSNYFSTLFKKYVGCSPSEYREKYRP